MNSVTDGINAALMAIAEYEKRAGKPRVVLSAEKQAPDVVRAYLQAVADTPAFQDEIARGEQVAMATGICPRWWEETPPASKPAAPGNPRREPVAPWVRLSDGLPPWACAEPGDAVK